MNHPISEAEVILEFLLRQLRAVKAMRYSAKTRPVPHLPMEVVTILASCQLFLSRQFRHIHVLLLCPHTCASPGYTSTVAYVVEDGTS